MVENPQGILVLDIPVIHKGYVDLLRRHGDDGSIQKLYLVGEDILTDLKIPKEIRANTPEVTERMLRGLGLPYEIEILGLDRVRDLPSEGIYTARDEVSRRLRERFFPEAKVTEETAFLRWDASNVTSTRPASVDEETSDPLHIGFIRRTRELAPLSSDWWRRVGVLIVRGGQILSEHYNQAFPTNHKPYIDGNPRDFIQAGTLQFLSSTVHAEPAAIAKARCDLEGADLYLNSFPCPPCAMVMGLAGIKRCFNAGGNAYLDAAEVLRAVGIKSIFVNEG